MKILFITGLYTKQSEFVLKSNSTQGLQNAPNTFQWAIVEGLSQLGVDYKVVSCPFLPAYPLSYKKLYTPEAPILYQGEKIGDMLSYCDLMIYKTKSIQKNLEKYIKKWVGLHKESGEKLVILTYTPYPPFIKAIKKFCKPNNIILATIVTDLVDDMMYFESNRSFLKRMQSFIEFKETKSLYKHVDKFVLLTKAMEEKIPESVGKNIVIEGITSIKHDIQYKKDKDQKILLYTGTLEKFACVDKLVRAFMQLKMPNVKLTICGDGPLKQMILDAAKDDYRIDFRGLVSRETAVQLQKDATLLINPRQPDDGITKYSFPSKTMEYLSSGTPMIGYKLDGIPKEYYSYYYTIEDTDEETLISTLNEVLTKSSLELNEKAMSAYNFIFREKSAKAQAAKILNFIKS